MHPALLTPIAPLVFHVAQAHVDAQARAERATYEAGRLATVALARTPIPERTAPKRMSREAVRRHNARIAAHLGDGLAKQGPRWRHVVVHHTASEWSSLARIDAYHRDKFEDPDGIEYHFLIGNGKRRPDGYVERARWDLQERSIHLFKPEGAPDAITISLVGNFHEREMGEAQYEATRDLVVALARRHGIPAERVTTHTRVDGRLTVCPGKYFPTKRLLADVAQALE
jgi:hypothetical protein